MSESSRSLALSSRTFWFVEPDVIDWVPSGLAWDLAKRAYQAIRAKFQRQPPDAPITSLAVGQPGYPGQRLAEECDDVLLKYLA